MPKGDKFIALTSYLEKCDKESIKMTFEDVKRILGFELSNSAYMYPAQWSNSESQSFAFGWLNAGYRTQQVNIVKQTVEFAKVKSDQTKEKTQPKSYKVKKYNHTLPVDVAVKHIKDYFKETLDDPHGRYLSWCHCYNTFTKNRHASDKKTLDYLSLHLAFYLASWGMYRGSSFLLQKDYKVHIPVVKIIQEEKFNPLCGITAENLIEDRNLDLLDELSERIRKSYADEKPSFSGKVNNTTDTLITKILLGTLGCVPAYDRYYVQTVKKYKISSDHYNRKSVQNVASYYIENKYSFEKLRKSLCAYGTEYPPMKLMDMCMWQAAYIKDNEK